MARHILKIVLSEGLSKADAIVCLEGDGQERTKKTLKIFKEGWAPIIIVSGGYDNPPFSIIAEKMAGFLVQKGVPEKKIIVEQNSKNTREQAEEVAKIIKRKSFKKIILVASDFHQLRAYLTFLKALQDLNLKITVINAPAKDNHKSLLEQEFKKIKEYQKKGHIFTFKEALKYQKWKEKQQ